ncbi:hypothetical protein FOA52_001255, partial [Chlamydomonas sp. UWO 241]
GVDNAMTARTSEITAQMRSGVEVQRDDVLILDGAYRGAAASSLAASIDDLDAIVRDLDRGSDDDDEKREVIARAQARIAALPGSLASSNLMHPLMTIDSLNSIDFDQGGAPPNGDAPAPSPRGGAPRNGDDDAKDRESIARVQARIASLPCSLASSTTLHPLKTTDEFDSGGAPNGDAPPLPVPSKRGGSGGGGGSGGSGRGL